MQNHVYEWDRVILGSTLPAYLFAYQSSIPVVGFKESAPHRFADSGKSLSDWNTLSFLLGMSAQLPFGDNISNVTVTDTGLRVTTKKLYKSVEIKCNKIFLFDDYNVDGLPPILEEGKLYEVMDWIDVRSIQPHDVEEIDCNRYSDTPIKKIYFCNTGRVENPRNKDICVLSYMNGDTLNDFEYSETMTRMSVESILRKEGMRGCVKNKASETRKSPTYKEIRLESAYRSKKRIAPHVYADSDLIEYMLDKKAEYDAKKNFTQDPLCLAQREDF